MPPLFKDADQLVQDINNLKTKVATRSAAGSTKIARVYADFDDRVTKAEASLSKSLDEKALNVESAIAELTNLGEQVLGASSGSSEEEKPAGTFRATAE
jgi:hypothetical protein